MNSYNLMGGRRNGKSIIMVETAKLAQSQGKRVIWATNDQAKTSELLARHGAVCEIIGTGYVVPHFRKNDRTRTS